MYGHTAAGLATAKTLRLSLMNANQTFVDHIELTASYGYNNEGKLTSMGQPGYHTGAPQSAVWINGEQYT